MNTTTQPTPTADLHSPALDDVALTFAHAHHRWQRLGSDAHSWNDPARQRELAAAFLHYHAAKLMLTEAATLGTGA